MNDDIITVVVPCYNVEMYVENTLKSLINQTYKKIKILAIDDCSKDNTYEILKRIEKENENKIKVLRNEKNMGLAYTRNRGIKLADTKFVGFIDSDDYVDNNYYDKLMRCNAKRGCRCGNNRYGID